jgi:hypothetical protein
LTLRDRILAKYRSGNIEYDEAIRFVGEKAFDDVVPHFFAAVYKSKKPQNYRWPGAKLKDGSIPDY